MTPFEFEQDIKVKIKICNVLINSYQTMIDTKSFKQLSLEQCQIYLEREEYKLSELKSEYPEYFI